MNRNGIILFGHGSRDPFWRRPMDRVAELLAQSQPQALVRCAFLELQQPDLATAAGELVAAGATHIAIVPMFLGVGKHVRDDLPALVDAFASSCPEVQFVLKPPVGEDAVLLERIAAIAAG